MNVFGASTSSLCLEMKNWYCRLKGIPMENRYFVQYFVSKYIADSELLHGLYIDIKAICNLILHVILAIFWALRNGEMFLKIPHVIHM